MDAKEDPNRIGIKNLIMRASMKKKHIMGEQSKVKINGR
jgi:hypothetical protein